jgi:ABC-type branched-subunit amino acid transport system substrate-binding protein
MKFSFFLQWITAALLTLSAGVAAAQLGVVTDNQVTIHHIGPLTGALAGSNKKALEGAKLHLDAVNAFTV